MRPTDDEKVLPCVVRHGAKHRPADITTEEIVAWTKEMQEYIEEEGVNRLTRVNPEVWYGGMYLARELKKLQCDDDLNERICFACGQRQAFANDPWVPVHVAIENYKKGVWDEPGEELARTILHEKFGPKPNPIDILNYMSDIKGVSIENMVKTIFQPCPKSPWDKGVDSVP